MRDCYGTFLLFCCGNVIKRVHFLQQLEKNPIKEEKITKQPSVGAVALTVHVIQLLFGDR